MVPFTGRFSPVETSTNGVKKRFVMRTEKVGQFIQHIRRDGGMGSSFCFGQTTVRTQPTGSGNVIAVVADAKKSLGRVKMKLRGVDAVL